MTCLIRLVAGSLSLLFVSPLGALAAEPAVRVELLADAPSVRVTVPGPCRLLTLPERQTLKTVPELRWQEVRPHPDGLQVGPWTLATGHLQIAADDRPTVYLNGVRYRGRLTVVRVDDRRLQVITEMPLEEYLAGVVPMEVDHRWPFETLKAQAIVARTMAWLQVADHAAHAFDVTLRWPQLYGGLPAERLRALQAIEATRGVVVTDRGRLLPTYYHTVCGGRTEDASQVWPTVQRDPLRGVACRACRGAPSSHWRLVLTDEELGQALQRQGIAVGSVTALTVGPRNPSGRVTAVTVTGDGGTTTIPAVPFRNALGPNRLRSTNFSVHREASRWVFDGAGWGHGVGLCQWGAAGLGRRRRTAAQILAAYYPGAEVVSLTP